MIESARLKGTMSGSDKEMQVTGFADLLGTGSLDTRFSDTVAHDSRLVDYPCQCPDANVPPADTHHRHVPSRRTTVGGDRGTADPSANRDVARLRCVPARRAILNTLLSAIVVVALSPLVAAQEPGVADIPDDVNTCVLCHSTPEFWTGEKARYYVQYSDLAGDVHFEKGIKCYECHGGNPTSLDAATAHSSAPRAEMAQACGKCHEAEYTGLATGVHAQASPDGQGSTGPLTCTACHTEKAHHILPIQDRESPVHTRNQVKVCGSCHEGPTAEYAASGHGFGLFQAGLISSAVCADCHGAHGIYKASNKQSTLHTENVAETCAQCHRYIEQRLSKSVHGRGNGLGSATNKPAPGGDVKRRPSCTDCHQGHDLPDPSSVEFRSGEADRCGNCHGDLNLAYGMSMHGELTKLGYDEGAKCADCHGAHDILPISDPNSRMAPANRMETCATCHPGISPNLVSFDPHANHYDKEQSAAVYWAYHGVLTFIICVFGFFGLHAILWFLRGLLDVIMHGRPKVLAPAAPSYVRFRPFHRYAHTVMVISFLGLALTGLPLKFSQYQWAQWLAYLLGGCWSTGIWHRVFSISMFGCFFAYVFLLVKTYFTQRRAGLTRLQTIFGPDSPIPNLRDARDFIANVKWFFGLGPKPTFERWAYWEKFDFFGAASDTTLIGVTGLILWFPNWFSQFLPGEAVNIAKVVHSTLALLATGFVFAIHFFGTHFRADKFPMDMSILTGVVSEEEMQHERPELLERWRAEGRLEEARAVAPQRGKMCGVRILGFVALFVGLAALAGIIWSLLV